MVKAIIESSVGLVLIFSFLTTSFAGVLSVILGLINYYSLYLPCRVIFMRSTAVLLIATAAHFLVVGVYEQIEWRDVSGLDMLKMILSILFAVFFITIAVAVYKMI